MSEQQITGSPEKVTEPREGEKQLPVPELAEALLPAKPLLPPSEETITLINSSLQKLHRLVSEARLGEAEKLSLAHEANSDDPERQAIPSPGPREIVKLLIQSEKEGGNRLEKDDRKIYKRLREAIVHVSEFCERASLGFRFVPEETESHSRYLDACDTSYQMVLHSIASLTSYVEKNFDVLNKKLERPFSPPQPEPEPEPPFVPVPEHQQLEPRQKPAQTVLGKLAARLTQKAVTGGQVALGAGAVVLSGIVGGVVFPVKWLVFKPLQYLWNKVAPYIKIPQWLKTFVSKTYNLAMDLTLRPLWRGMCKFLPPLESIGNKIGQGADYLKRRYQRPVQLRTNGLAMGGEIATTRLWCINPSTNIPTPLNAVLAQAGSQLKNEHLYVKKQVPDILSRGTVPWSSAHCEYYVTPGKTHTFPLSEKHTVTAVSFYDFVGDKIDLTEAPVIEEGVFGTVKIKVPSSLTYVKTVVYQIEAKTGSAATRTPEGLHQRLLESSLAYSNYHSEETESFHQALALVSSPQHRLELVKDIEQVKGFILTDKTFPTKYVDRAGDLGSVALDGLRMGSRHLLSRHLSHQLTAAGVPCLLKEGPVMNEKGNGFEEQSSHLRTIAILPDEFVSIDNVNFMLTTEAKINPSHVSWGEYFGIMAEAKTADAATIYQTARELHFRLQGKQPELFYDESERPDFSLRTFIINNLEALSSKMANRRRENPKTPEIGSSISHPGVQELARQIGRVAYYYQTEKVFARCLENGSLAEAHWHLQHNECRAGSFGDGFNRLPEEFHKLKNWDEHDRFLDVTAEALAAEHFNREEKHACLSWIVNNTAPQMKPHQLLFQAQTVYNSHLPLVPTRKAIKFITAANMEFLEREEQKSLATNFIQGMVAELRENHEISGFYHINYKESSLERILNPFDAKIFAEKLDLCMETLRNGQIELEPAENLALARSMTLLFRYFHEANQNLDEAPFTEALTSCARAFSTINELPGVEPLHSVLELIDGNHQTQEKVHLVYLLENAPDGTLSFISNGNITPEASKAMSGLLARRLLIEFNVYREYKELFEDLERQGFLLDLSIEQPELSKALLPIVSRELKRIDTQIINFPGSKAPASTIIAQFASLPSAAVARTMNEIVKRNGITLDTVIASWPSQNERKIARYLAKNISTEAVDGRQLMMLEHSRYPGMKANPAEVPSLALALLGEDKRAELIINSLKSSGHLNSSLEEPMQALSQQFPEEWKDFIAGLHQRFSGRGNMTVRRSIHRTYQELLAEPFTRQELHNGYLWLAGALIDRGDKIEEKKPEVSLEDLLEPLIEPSAAEKFKKRYPKLMQSLEILTSVPERDEVSCKAALQSMNSDADTMRMVTDVSYRARAAVVTGFILSHAIEGQFDTAVIADELDLNTASLKLLENRILDSGKPAEVQVWNALFDSSPQRGFPVAVKQIAEQARQQVDIMRRNMRATHRTLFARYLLHESGSIRPQAHSGDFEEFVPYRPGDDVRRIDWKSSGRIDRLVIRKYREEEERPRILTVDLEWLTEGYEQWSTVKDKHKHLQSQMYPRLERFFTLLAIAADENVPLTLELRSRCLLKRYENICDGRKSKQIPSFLKDDFINELSAYLAKANQLYSAEAAIFGENGYLPLNMFAPGETINFPPQTTVIAGVHRKNLTLTGNVLGSLRSQNRFVQILKQDTALEKKTATIDESADDDSSEDDVDYDVDYDY